MTVDPFRTGNPFREKHPLGATRRPRRERKIDGRFQRAYAFGGRKIGRVKGHLRHKAGEKRRLEDGRVIADVRLARIQRTRRIYARMPGAFRGNVVDTRMTRSRKIEKADR